jgi:hypothetical protein
MEWVSVKDRLPEKYGEYLVFFICFWCEGVIDFWMDVQTYNPECNYWARCNNDHVAFWMQLPEPPTLSNKSFNLSEGKAPLAS